MLTVTQFTAWIDGLAAVFEENKEYLTDLDAAIGDADHGINLARGFAAANAALAAAAPTNLAAACMTVARSLIKSVGGASGPLYGNVFMKLGPAFGQGDEAAMVALAKGFADGIEGIMKMGKSGAGEKTMLDAWIPAVAAMEEAIAAGADDGAVIGAATESAERGMKMTIDMVATKGRASYLGQRSVGHQDPGATSTWMLIRTLAGIMGTVTP